MARCWTVQPADAVKVAPDALVTVSSTASLRAGAGSSAEAAAWDVAPASGPASAAPFWPPPQPGAAIAAKAARASSVRLLVSSMALVIPRDIRLRAARTPRTNQSQ